MASTRALRIRRLPCRSMLPSRVKGPYSPHAVRRSVTRSRVRALRPFYAAVFEALPVHHLAVEHRGGEVAEAVGLMLGGRRERCDCVVEREDLVVHKQRVLAHLFEHIAQPHLPAAGEQIRKARPRLAAPPTLRRSLDSAVVNEPASLPFDASAMADELRTMPREKAPFLLLRRGLANGASALRIAMHHAPRDQACKRRSVPLVGLALARERLRRKRKNLRAHLAELRLKQPPKPASLHTHRDAPPAPEQLFTKRRHLRPAKRDRSDDALRANLDSKASARLFQVPAEANRRASGRLGLKFFEHAQPPQKRRHSLDDGGFGRGSEWFELVCFHD